MTSAETTLKLCQLKMVQNTILELNGERKASMVVISDAATLYSLSRENFIDVLGDTALRYSSLDDCIEFLLLLHNVN